MPYSAIDLWTNFSRFILAFSFLFIVLPKIVFPARQEEDILERFYANLTRMVLLVISLGYFLVAVKLFEFFSFILVFFAIVVRLSFNCWSGEKEKSPVHKATESFFDITEKRVNLEVILHTHLNKWFNSLIKTYRRCWGGATGTRRLILFIIIMGGSAYLRFFDPLANLAPSMSDSYVTLAWMKYIERCQLFHDGIYPQGFHTYLAVLHLFAATDALFVLKFAGPLNSFLITLGIYFTASRFTGSFNAGLAAAFVYGLLGHYLPNDYVRQAATNSQEFGMVFILPGIWFAAKYISTGNKYYLINTTAALVITGLVHSFTAFFLACGLLAVTAAGLFSGLLTRQKFVHLLSAGISAVIISMLPALVGLAMGKSFHSASMKYIILKGAPINQLDLFGQLALAGALLYPFLTFIKTREQFRIHLGWTGLLLVSIYIAIFQLPRFGIDNTALATRSRDFVSLAIPLGISFLVSFISQWLPGKVRGVALSSMLVYGAMAVSLSYWPPVIAAPYKMQSEASVRQYYRISREYRPTEWLMVSRAEGYALVLGRSWHMVVSDFLTRFAPSGERLWDKQDGKELKISHIFIFHEKNLFVPVVEEEDDIAQHKSEEIKLANWINTYRKHHTNMQVFYEDNNLAVYVIHQTKSKKEKFEQIWGSEPIW